MLFGSYVVIFPRMYSYLEKWEKTNEETMCIFPPLVHHRLPTVLSELLVSFPSVHLSCAPGLAGASCASLAEEGEAVEASFERDSRPHPCVHLEERRGVY